MFDRKSNIDPKRVAAWIFCGLSALAAVYLFLKYALGIIVPFLIALIFAFITNRPSEWLSQKTRISKKLCSFFLLLLSLLGVSALLFFGINRLIYEGERLLSHLANDSAKLGSAIGDIFNRISSIGDKKIPLVENLMKIEAFREFWENIDSIVASVISDTVSSLTKALPNLIFSVFARLPGFLIFILVTLIASFYLCLDYDKIKDTVISYLPDGFAGRLPAIKRRICDTAAKYIRAYLLLLLLTFVQLFVGFSFLRAPYPFLMAFLIALVDFLPVLGVGTVLIPWGLFELLFSKNIFLGAGLLILYIIVVIVRQITEPKIIAGSLGLHPLIALISMYGGLKLFGILGMILGPVIALAVKSVLIPTVDKKASL